MSTTTTSNKQHQQHAHDNDSSIWQLTEHIYHIDSTTHQLPHHLSLLSQACPDYQIQLQLQFQSFQTLQKFQKKLQQQHQVYRGQKIIDKNDFLYQWQQIYSKTRATNRSMYIDRKLYRVTFAHPIELTIFYKMFSKQLVQLQRQYKYLILPFRKQLRVYLMDDFDEKISSFFTTQLIQMKKTLWMYIQVRVDMYELVRYSKLAQKKLLNQGVQFMILSLNKHVVFYSVIAKSRAKIKLITRKILSYHISVIKFPEINIDQYILCEIMKLIVRELRPVIKEVNDRYEMPVEVDVEQAVIVVNDIHQVFVDGLKRLEEELWQTKIIEISCKEITLLRRILLNPIYQELIKYEVKYRKCFLIFGKLPEAQKLKIRYKNLLTQLLKEMTDCFAGMYTIIIHTMHLYNNTERLRKQTERLLMLASVYGLNVVTYHRVTRMNGFYKVVIEPKELSEYNGRKRAGNVMRMLEWYVNGEQVVEEQLMKSDQFLFESYRQIIEVPNQQIYTSSQHLPHRIDKKQLTALLWYNQQQTQPQQLPPTLLIEQQYPSQKIPSKSSANISTIMDQKEYPERRVFEDKNIIYVRSKRALKVQRKLELKFNRRLRVWRLVINESVDMSNNNKNTRNSKNPNINYPIAYKQLSLISTHFTQYHNNQISLKPYSQTQLKFIENLNQGQHAIVCFVNREMDLFLPVYELEVVE